MKNYLPSGGAIAIAALIFVTMYLLWGVPPFIDILPGEHPAEGPIVVIAAVTLFFAMAAGLAISVIKYEDWRTKK